MNKSSDKSRFRSLIVAVKHWLFPGRRIASGFRLLSESIIEGRKRESELRRRISDLELRVWDLEDHSPEEMMGQVKEMMGAYQEKVSQMREEVAGE